MSWLHRSFYAKLSALFLVLIMALGVMLALLCTQSVMRFMDEAEQKLNRTLASDMAAEFQPFLHTHIDVARIRQKIAYMTGINPRIEIYLLGSNGMIKASFVGPGQRLEQQIIDTEPLDRFLAGAELPLLGDDPLKRGRHKPFSVAPIEIMGEKGCYLYVILGSERYASTAAMIRDSYIMQATLRGLGLSLLGTGVLGVALFGLLTRRLRTMKEVVGAFERGELDRRMEIGSSDEIGQLAVTFNQMADTIAANVEELKRTDRLRRELIANVSHDLRSPLASIQGYLETITIKGDSVGPEEREQYLQTVLKNTRALNQLVGELFELSKLDAQQVQPDLEVFALAELVQDVVMQFKPVAERSGIDLGVLLPERPLRVLADIALLERAVSNLIDNALQYTSPGGHVRVACRVNEDQVGVEITDTGCGIPAEDLPHIFERFYRVEKSRAPGGGGAGLGLAITSRILELHGTELEVQSVLGHGTTFSFWLPACESSPATASVSAGREVADRRQECDHSHTQ